MKIKLMKLEIRNFKGIRSFKFLPEGNSTNVFGDNGTGKTTLYDAFLWALFGKDSSNKSSFDWKPLDENNEEINHLETQVIVTLDVDGTIKTLSRMTIENWVRKRGSIEELFDGHTTTYQIDGITVKQKDYKAYLEELIGEEKFKILTQLNYFTEILDWKKRRDVLIEMVGDITDEKVIESNKELAPLTKILDGAPVENKKKLIEQTMKQINKDIKSLPGRIDEVDRSLPDLTGLNKTTLESHKGSLQATISLKRDEVSHIKNGFGTSILENEISQEELRYKELRQDYRTQSNESVAILQKEKSELNEKLFDAQTYLREVQSEISNKEWSIQDINNQITRLESENDKGRAEFYEIQKETMEPFGSHKLSCPTCGTEYKPEKADEIQSKYEKEVEGFNSKKSEKLAGIKEKGITNANKINALQEELTKLGEDIKSLDTSTHEREIADIQAKIQDTEKSIQAKQNEIVPFDDTDEALKIKNEILSLRDQLEIGNKDQSKQIEAINLEVREIEKEISTINDSLYQFTLYANQSKRKEELVNEEKNLGSEYGNLEQQLFLIEEFVRTKVNMLTEGINSRFKLVKFRLFKTNINGGLEEVCEPTVNGANYSTGLNNAARINAGLDVINTLMEHYEKKVPVFVDNAESINEILPIDTQLITLAVSTDKALKIEEDI